MTAPVTRPWSSSAADAYALCPSAWAQRFGKGRPASGVHADPAIHADVHRRRGRVLHRAVSVALYAARQELAGRTTPLTGATLERYWRPARIEMGKAWDEEKMPSDPDVAVLCVEMLQRTLRAVPVPRPGAIYGIEHKFFLTLASGIDIVFIPDYAWWVDERAGVLRIVDWKSASIEADDVGRHQQLLRYSRWMQLLDPRVKRVQIELFAMREGVGYVEDVDQVMADRAASRFERIVTQARTATEHPPTPGKQCGGCFFKRTCPAVSPALGGKAVVDAA